MATTVMLPKTLQEQLEVAFTVLRRDEPLYQVRSAAWHRFLSMGLPTRKNEDFQYVPPLEPIADEGKGCLKTESSTDFSIVFIDGCFRPDLSQVPPGVILLPLSQAFGSYGAYLHKVYEQAIEREKDPFALLALALHAEGAFVYLPPHTKLDAPLWITESSSMQSIGSSRFVHLHVRFGAQAELSLASQRAPSTFSSSLYTLGLDAGARACYIELQPASHGAHFSALRTQLKREARLQSIGITAGAKVYRRSIIATLLGERAEVEIEGLCTLQGARQAHAHVIVEHKAPHTRSRQLFKSVLQGTSRSSFQGKISVAQAAQKTEAYQKSSSLVLSHGALAYAKPSLEIFADDVKASHGATVAELPAAPLLYLRTRGLTEAEAKQLLVGGFCREISDKIPWVCEEYGQISV